MYMVVHIQFVNILLPRLRLVGIVLASQVMHAVNLHVKSPVNNRVSTAELL